MLLPFGVPINSYGHAEPCFWYLTRDLSAISDFYGEGNLALGLIDTGLGRATEPLSFRFMTDAVIRKPAVRAAVGWLPRCD